MLISRCTHCGRPRVRNYCECYITGGVGGGPTYKEKAQAAIAAGYRAFRWTRPASENGGTTFNARERIHQVRNDCEEEAREGVRERRRLADRFSSTLRFRRRPARVQIAGGAGAVPSRGIRCGPRRSSKIFRKLRKQKTTVPLAAGEEWGRSLSFNKLVENHVISITCAQRCRTSAESPRCGKSRRFARRTSRGSSRISRSIAEAALVHAWGKFPGPVLFEYNYQTGRRFRICQYTDFKDGASCGRTNGRGWASN